MSFKEDTTVLKFAEQLHVQNRYTARSILSYARYK